MRTHSKRSTAFRPAINDIRLEDRVVLNGGGGTAHVVPVAAAISPAVRAQQSGAQNTFTRRELLSVYRQQFNAARDSLRQALSTQINQLFANGRPTGEQLANFRTLSSGAIDATALRVSSQLALLPRATDRLVAQLQNELLGNNRASLVSRINNFANSSRINQSAGRLDAAVNRVLGSFTTQAQGQFANFLTTTPILSIVAGCDDRCKGSRFGSSWPSKSSASSATPSPGSSQSFPNVATSALFNNGTMITDPAAQHAFGARLGSALGVINFQLANNIGVFRGLGSTLAPTLQQAFFGNGQTGTGGTTGFTNLFATLSSVPTTMTDFFPGVNTAFNNLFGSVSGSLTNAFHMLPTGSPNLPTGPLSNPWGPVLQSFGNGFNNGFGTGVMGFGQVPAGQGNSFSNGFGGLVTAQNTTFGFNQPAFAGFGLTIATGTTGTGGL